MLSCACIRSNNETCMIPKLISFLLGMGNGVADSETVFGGFKSLKHVNTSFSSHRSKIINKRTKDQEESLIIGFL